MRILGQRYGIGAGTISLRGSTTIPFKLSGNHTYIAATLGGERYSFIFDTGGTAVLTAQTQSKRKFPVLGQVDIAGAGAIAQSVDVVSIPPIAIGDAVYRGGLAPVITPRFPVSNPYPNFPFGGILGREFFKHLVTVIDYERSMLVFYEPTTFTPDPSAAALTLAMNSRETPYVQAQLNGASGRFNIDSGGTAGVVVREDFLQTAGIAQQFSPSARAVIGYGVGGIVTGSAARARTLVFGATTLHEPVVLIPGPDGGALVDSDSAGTIGGDILRRFVVVLNVPGSKLYLRPTARVTEAFGFNRAGLFPKFDGSTLSIDLVDSPSPASEAGIRASDVILSIAGRPAASYTHDEVMAEWMHPPGTRVQLDLRRENRTVSVTIVLRDLI